MENCIFCKIVDGKVPCVKIWEDEESLAMLDINPAHQGHTLVIPKKHIDYLFDLNDEEYRRLMSNAKNVAAKIRKGLKSEKVGIIVEGFEVRHAHVHLIPINKQGDVIMPRTGFKEERELEEVAKRIR